MGHLVRCKANMRDSFRGCEAYSAGSLCPAPVYTYAYGWDDKETPWLTVSQTPEASTLCSVYVCVGDGLEFTGKRQPAIKYLQQLSLKLLDQVWWPHKICQPSVSWTLSPRHCLLSPGATFSGIPSHTDFSFSKHSNPHISEPLQLPFPLPGIAFLLLSTSLNHFREADGFPPSPLPLTRTVHHHYNAHPIWNVSFIYFYLCRGFWFPWSSTRP